MSFCLCLQNIFDTTIWLLLGNNEKLNLNSWLNCCSFLYRETTSNIPFYMSSAINMASQIICPKAHYRTDLKKSRRRYDVKFAKSWKLKKAPRNYAKLPKIVDRWMMWPALWRRVTANWLSSNRNYKNWRVKYCWHRAIRPYQAMAEVSAYIYLMFLEKLSTTSFHWKRSNTIDIQFYNWPSYCVLSCRACKPEQT